jgi:hypothetical protein
MARTSKHGRQFLELGDRVECRITGAKGIVVALTVWLNGCVRISVQPERLEKGQPADPIHFDESQLKILKKNVVEAVNTDYTVSPAIAAPNTGGPHRESAGFKQP